MKTTKFKGALMALIPVTAMSAGVAMYATSPSDASPAAPPVAFAVPTSSGVQARDEMLLQQRASRSRPLIVRHAAVRHHVQRPVRRTVRRPVPVKVVTRRPARVVRASGVSFTDQEMRVRSCESGANGSATKGRAHDFNYKAENPSSTASGAWQFIDGTWGGFMGYSHAASAPRSVQDLKARQYIDANGLTPWTASRPCWGA